MRLRFPLLLLALAGPAAAQSPDDFAWQWPITLDGDAGAYTLVLDDAVYARATRADLRDIAVFNADGEPVPFAAQPVVLERSRKPVNWMRVARPDRAGGDETFSLRLQRNADGSLRDLDIGSARADATVPAPDLLVDLGADPPPVATLHVALADDAARPVNLRVRVLASDDLAQWRPLGDDLALVSLLDNGIAIERLRLDFATSNERYLRLSLSGDGDWPALARLERDDERTATAPPPARTVELTGTAVAGSPGVFDYTLPGPLPVTRYDVQPAAANTVAVAGVSTRDATRDARGDDAPWRPLGESTVFRLGSGDAEVRHLPQDIGARADRHWRVATRPAQSQPPVLRVTYRPDRFVLLAQGTPPYRLLAGSVRAQRPDYPVGAAIAAAGAQQPAGWQPPAATLGVMTEAAGDAALRADRGSDYRRWALWAVLAIGGLIVLLMSLRVLRQPPAE